MTPLIVVDSQPRGVDEIFDVAHWKKLESLGEVVAHRGPGRMPADQLEALLPRVELLIGQTDMPLKRLENAPKLRAIINVETNFLQNVDYEACFERGVHVITPSSAFARPVAEMTLGMAIDLCRGISRADRAMRTGQEKWLLDGWEGCRSLYGAAVGLIGFGDLARAFTPLVAPFGCTMRAYDPWVSAHYLRGFGVTPASLDEILSGSDIVIVFASVTSENQHFLGRREFELMRPGSIFLLMSRAAAVDFPELLACVRSGRLRAATDVFPVEPAPADDPARQIEGLLLSPHRAGATPDALLEIGRQTIADAELILKGLPPLSCRRAQRETVARSRSKPVE